MTNKLQLPSKVWNLRRRQVPLIVGALLGVIAVGFVVSQLLQVDRIRAQEIALSAVGGGEIVAIVIVLLIVIAVVAVLLFFFVFRRRYGRGSDSHSGEATSEVTTTEETVTGTEAVGGQYGGDFGLWDSEAPESDGKGKHDSE